MCTGEFKLIFQDKYGFNVIERSADGEFLLKKLKALQCLERNGTYSIVFTICKKEIVYDED